MIFRQSIKSVCGSQSLVICFSERQASTDSAAICQFSSLLTMTTRTDRICRSDICVDGGGGIQVAIQAQPEETESVAGSLPNNRFCLSNDVRKNQRVKTLQAREHGSNAGAEPMNENVHGQRCTPIVIARFGKDYASISRKSRKAREPGLLVEGLLQRIQIGSVPQEVEHYSRVNRSRAGAHSDSVQWSKAHGRIDRPVSPDGHQRTAAAQVTDDLTQVLIAVPVDDLHRSPTGVPVAGTVKTVTHQSLFNPLIRSCVGGGCFGQRSVEGRIEDRELRSLVTQDFSTRPNAFKINRVMQWRELSESVDGRFNVGSDKGCAAEFQTAMHDTMAGQVDLLRSSQHREPALPRRSNQRLDLFL